MTVEDDITWLERVGPITWMDDLYYAGVEIDDFFELIERLLTAGELLTESQAKRIYFSITGPLEGFGADFADILAKVPGSPFRWQLWDDRDDANDNLLDLHVRFMKESAFKGFYLDINPLPSYNIIDEPVRWLREVKFVDLSSYELHKVFVYAFSNLGLPSSMIQPEIQTAEGSRLLLWARSQVDNFEPRGMATRDRKQFSLEILDDRLKVGFR